MIKLYRINTGSCGGCDIEISIAVATDAELTWAASPYEADALLLTGPITLGSRADFVRLLRDLEDIPLLAIGRCSIDGQPFGRGGVQEFRDLVVRLQLDGCPPAPEMIANAIREALGYAPLRVVETPLEDEPLPVAARDAAAPAMEPSPQAEPSQDAQSPPPPEQTEPAVVSAASDEALDDEQDDLPCNDPAARRARLLKRIKPLRRDALSDEESALGEEGSTADPAGNADPLLDREDEATDKDDALDEEPQPPQQAGSLPDIEQPKRHRRSGRPGKASR